MSDASRQLAGIRFVVVPPRAERPSRLIALVHLGALLLAAATVTLGVSLPSPGGRAAR